MTAHRVGPVALALVLVVACQPRLTGPWKAARERGVAYRAIGQEPGWVAEVDAGERPPMRVSLDYGRRRLRADQTRRFEEPPTRTTGYRGTADGTSVELRDSMSGEAFETRAELVVNGATYRGCGRFLKR
jgi:putative lipoprotein